ARVVREGDEFNFEFGLDEKLIHRPGENEDAPVTHVYAVARLKDGGTQFEVMTRKQIELVRSQSKAGNNGPWVTHWEEMAKKTAIRRLFKYLPVSIEIQRAVSMDEKEPLTIDPADSSVLTGEYSVIDNSEE
ncbi:recombinase RecT, partial [Escherichia coli]|nr:recombinase RecT [Escherichia coli]